jgi:hypothetical protein
MEHPDKKWVCNMITNITELTRILDEMKKGNSDNKELNHGISTIELGIGEIKSYVINSLDTKTINQNKISQLEPLNLTKITMCKTPEQINRTIPARPIKISPRIITSAVRTTAIKENDNLPGIKRRHTDCTISYRA